MHRIDWLRVERFALYSSLILFCAFETLCAAVPALKGIVPEQVELAVITAFILIGLHHLIRIVEQRSLLDKEILLFQSISDGFQKWVEALERIDELKIAAYTSDTFRGLLEAHGRPIKRAKILLFRGDQPIHPEAPAVQESDLALIQQEWLTLKRDKKVGKFEIRRIYATAAFYAALCNRDRVLAGLFFPGKGKGGLRMSRAVVILPGTLVTTRLRKEVEAWFDAMWKVAVPLTKSLAEDSPSPASAAIEASASAMESQKKGTN